MSHKLSSALFVLIGVLGTVMAIRMLFDPASLLPMLDAMGPSTAPLRSADAAALVAFLGHWVAIALIGGNLSTVVVALTALRRKERWAAWLMLYWPLMFATHFFLYEPGPMRIVQIFWLCLSVPAFVVLVTRAQPASSTIQRTRAA